MGPLRAMHLLWRGMSSGPFTVAELARAVGMSVDEVRAYRAGGLLQAPRRRRSRSGDLAFHAEHVDRLRFIQRALAYGFSAERYALVPPFIFLFIAAHAIGQGAVIWVYLSEIFPNAARASGQAFGTATHWVLAATLTLVMPAVLDAVPTTYIFLFFTGMMTLQLVFVLAVMPETRGRSLEDISADLARP